MFSAFDFTSLSFLADLILKLSSTIIKGSIDEYLHKFCYFLLLKPIYTLVLMETHEY